MVPLLDYLLPQARTTMPTVLRSGAYQFIIFTADHPPVHIHVRGSGHLAKVRLDPIEIERSGGFNQGDLTKIVDIIRENQALLLAEWDRFYPTR